MPTKYDLAIIGSGGGAFAAAIRASTLGKSVVMIERGTLGGTCVNTGCVPSKALIAAADARHSAADAADRFPGIATTAGPVDMPALIAGKQALVESLRGEKYADVADSYGWAVRRGDAAFAGTPDAPVLQVAGDDGSTETIEAGHFLVATGSRPWAPPIDGLDSAGYLTSTTAMELLEVPRSLLVLGGGSAGYAAALRSVQYGKSVALVEKSKVGGTCLHWGCIPTKAYLHAAEVADAARHGSQFGIHTTLDRVDAKEVVAYADSVVSRLFKHGQTDRRQDHADHTNLSDRGAQPQGA